MKPSVKIGIFILAIALGYYLDTFLGVAIAGTIALTLITFIDEGFDEAARVLRDHISAMGAMFLSAAICLVLKEAPEKPLPQYILYIVFFILSWKFYDIFRDKPNQCNCKNKH